jgi:uncharacterized membrane protein YhiD involved in acid resistance
MPEELLLSNEAPPKPALVWPSTPWEWQTLAIQLGAAFVFGLLVALIYALTMRSSRRASSRPFLATLVLLSVLIAMVTLVIGNSLARAFGLVGALSIVRFRTVVQDTRDTAFVIFTVVVGMGAGAGYLAPPLLGMPLVFLAAWLFRPRRTSRDPREAELVLRVRNANPPGEPVRRVLEKHLSSYRQTAVSTARGGAALDVTYHVHARAPDSYLALVTELTPIEGVQSVEVKEG